MTTETRIKDHQWLSLLSKDNDMNQKRFLNLYSTLHYEKLTSHLTLKKQVCHYIAVKNQIISSLENN